MALRDHDGDDDDNDGIIDAGKTGAGEPATPMRLWTVGKGSDTSAVDTGDDEGYAAAIQLSDPIKRGDTWTYYIEAVDTNPDQRWDTTWLLDHEGNTSRRAGGVAVEYLDITVAVIDGTQSSVLAASSGTNNLDQDGEPNEEKGASPRRCPH